MITGRESYIAIRDGTCASSQMDWTRERHDRRAYALSDSSIVSVMGCSIPLTRSWASYVANSSFGRCRRVSYALHSNYSHHSRHVFVDGAGNMARSVTLRCSCLT